MDREALSASGELPHPHPVTFLEQLPPQRACMEAEISHSGHNSNLNTFHLKIFIKIKIKPKKMNYQNAALCIVLQASEEKMGGEKEGGEGKENPLCSSQRAGRREKTACLHQSQRPTLRELWKVLWSQDLLVQRTFHQSRGPRVTDTKPREQIFPRLCKLEEFDWRTGIWEQYSESLQSLKGQKPGPGASNCPWASRSAGRS